MADSGSGVRERRPRRRDGLPVVGALAEGELEHARRGPTAALAVRLDRPERIVIGADGTDRELTDAASRVGDARWRLGSEALVDVLVPVEHHVGVVFVQRVPEWSHRAVVTVLRAR